MVENSEFLRYNICGTADRSPRYIEVKAMQYMNETTIRALLPVRKRDTHKGDYGKILLLCGSRGFTGAAALAAMGALRTGAGLVYLAVPESIYAIEAVKLTEPVVLPLPDGDGMLCAASIPQIAALLPKMDAVLFGSGSGLGEGTEAVLLYLLKNCDCPLILDADGITLAAKHKDILRDRSAPTILTPPRRGICPIGSPGSAEGPADHGPGPGPGRGIAAQGPQDPRHRRRKLLGEPDR